jgi:hypothetical protein
MCLKLVMKILAWNSAWGCSRQEGDLGPLSPEQHQEGRKHACVRACARVCVRGRACARVRAPLRLHRRMQAPNYKASRSLILQQGFPRAESLLLEQESGFNSRGVFPAGGRPRKRQ